MPDANYLEIARLNRRQRGVGYTCAYILTNAYLVHGSSSLLARGKMQRDMEE